MNLGFHCFAFWYKIHIWFSSVGWLPPLISLIGRLWQTTLFLCNSNPPFHQDWSFFADLVSLFYLWTTSEAATVTSLPQDLVRCASISGTFPVSPQVGWWHCQISTLSASLNPHEAWGFRDFLMSYILSPRLFQFAYPAYTSSKALRVYFHQKNCQTFYRSICEGKQSRSLRM